MSKARAQKIDLPEDPLMMAFGVDEGRLAKLRDEHGNRPFGGNVSRIGEHYQRPPGRPAEFTNLPGVVGEERMWPNRGKSSHRLKAQLRELSYRAKDVKSYIIIHDLKTYQASSFLKLIYVYLLARIVMWWRRE